jgi:hypothetical protein
MIIRFSQVFEGFGDPFGFAQGAARRLDDQAETTVVFWNA